MCYYIIQISLRLRLARSQAPPPKIREVEPRWHFCGYLPHRRYVMPSRLPPRDCVSPYVYPSERSNARLSAALRDHPGSRLPRRGIDLEFYVVQDATSKYRARVLSVALSYVASSLAGPRPGIRMTPQICVASQSNAISHAA